MKLLDTVFMIANKKVPNVVYGRPGKTAHEAWNNVMEDEVMGTGVSKEDLFNRGFRATQVQIVSVP